MSWRKASSEIANHELARSLRKLPVGDDVDDAPLILVGARSPRVAAEAAIPAERGAGVRREGKMATRLWRQRVQKLVATVGLVVVILVAREDVHRPARYAPVDCWPEVFVLALQDELMPPANGIDAQVCGELKPVTRVLPRELGGRREERDHSAPGESHVSDGRPVDARVHGEMPQGLVCVSHVLAR